MVAIPSREAQLHYTFQWMLEVLVARSMKALTTFLKALNIFFILVTYLFINL